MMTLSNEIKPRARDADSRITIQTEDAEPSVDRTCDEESVPRKYLIFKSQIAINKNYLQKETDIHSS